MRRALLVMCLVLAGCTDHAKERQRWLDRCQASTFTVAQCQFLHGVVKQAQDEADGAALTSGMAVGLAVGVAGSR